ncbi:MAG: LysR family transcriptional regulator [Betaproteobacteria bacterium]|nr:LysR family transcriptional regulator [Betaproteobacteria bacterium]
MQEADTLRFFVTIVRHGSLAAAARALDLTPSAVTQRLQALEARLGVRLLHRSARRIHLTDEGELYYTVSARLTQQYDELIDTLQSRRLLVSGRLVVHGPLGFGRRYLAPMIAQFHAEHPQLQITLTLSDKNIDPEAALFDVIVHIGELKDSSRVAYPLAPNRRWACASPGYLKRHGTPASPADLVHHAALVLRENEEDVTLWRFSSKGREQSVRVSPALASNDGGVIKQWALMGKGVMVRSEWDVAEEVRNGKLVRLMPGWLLPAADVVALVPQRKGKSARVEAFLQFIALQFKPHPPWRGAR